MKFILSRASGSRVPQTSYSYGTAEEVIELSSLSDLMALMQEIQGATTVRTVIVALDDPLPTIKIYDSYIE
jgi:hypothetical protein